MGYVRIDSNNVTIVGQPDTNMTHKPILTPLLHGKSSPFPLNFILVKYPERLTISPKFCFG